MVEGKSKQKHPKCFKIVKKKMSLIRLIWWYINQIETPSESHSFLCCGRVESWQRLYFARSHNSEDTPPTPHLVRINNIAYQTAFLQRSRAIKFSLWKAFGRSSAPLYGLGAEFAFCERATKPCLSMARK